jgi:hypothetical protein
LNFNFPPMTVAELLATDALVLAELLLMIGLVFLDEKSRF